MKNMIVELHRIKEQNEHIRRAQEKQHKLNEILLQSLQERNNGEKPQAKAEMGPEFGNSAERKRSSSQETQKYGNQAWTTSKRKVYHLEG